jgi:hypothetical protein
MNRLVIIGNGFDLAHGLPTSYGHFIDDFWASINNSKAENNFISFKESLDIEFKNVKCLNDLGNYLKQFDDKIKFSEGEIYTEFGNNFRTGKYSREHFLIYKNIFFKIINQKKSISNWVDVENEYYRLLKEITTKDFLINNSSLDDKEELTNRKKADVEILNREFEEVKNLFEKYLCEKVIKRYVIDFSILENKDWIKFYNYLKPISLFNNEENILKEFLNKEDNLEIKNHFNLERREEVVNKIYFLNFNYTPILNTYCYKLNEDDRIECDINFIHGELENNNENKINFGFGDEMDDDYKAIENINDNEYLRYFKSFQYLQNSNYSNLLSYIDSDKFQVLIMGHSCGLSDRTLLNTIFEHNNCRSIKVFYHQWKDKNTDEVKDNYTEITQNISRHFNKKKLMREKIVNKTLCQPLPQIQLHKKE